MKVILQILSLVGALGLFLYGMKVMSESLQKMAGKNMRNALARITAKPGRGILAGVLVTGAIQSSSATTVMLVSFVNAGLVSFTESLGVVFGANIGTTVTAWIISLLGFGSGFNFYDFLLPLIALSLPLVFSYNSLNRARAEFIIGFALLFIGIYFFKQQIPAIDENSPLFQQLQSLNEYRFSNVLLFVGMGILVTVIFQSSSATITLTMILATQGWLSLSYALAMVLGENIGTTVTANLAAIVGNKSAKRTALAHFLFNSLGVVWVLLFFGFFAGAIQRSIQGLELYTGQAPQNVIPIGISIFHSGFNIINTLIFTIFIRQFSRFCYWILPNGSSIHEEFSLRFIDTSLLSTSELSILQARKEIANMGRQAQKLFIMIPDLLVEKNEKKFTRKLNKIQQAEDIIDEMEVEIANYITKISQDDLSEEGIRRVRAMLKIIDNIESISDMCYQMALTIAKKNESKAWFTQELRNNLDKEFRLIEKALEHMNVNLDRDYPEVDIETAAAIEEEINSIRSQLRKTYLEEIKREKFPYQTGVFYNDLLSISEKIGDYAYNVNQAMQRTKGTEMKKNQKLKDK
ncbi:MAG: Na/Pi cotransporter family protein [Bacteroidales bacterium]